MRSMRSSFIFAIFLFLFFVILLIATLGYPTRAKIFPLLVVITALALLSNQIWREGFALRRQKEAPERAEGPNLGRAYLGVALWIAATAAMLLLLGFLATVVLLPLLYSRHHGERWLVSLCLSLGCTTFFYAIFVLALKLPLYQGLLYLTIFG